MLDSLRIAAAFMVLIFHGAVQWLPSYPDAVALLSNLAHAAVVVFFVLSGYLISYTTTSNNRGVRQYSVARLSRLYSIVLPALLITIGIELLVRSLNPTLAAEYSRGNSLPRYVLSFFFCTEVNFFSTSPPINGPLWSLSYEFWYYVLFGLWFYRTTYRKSSLILCLVGLFVGPKILLLMPIWLLGYLAYRLPKPPIQSGLSWLYVLLLLSTVCLLAIYLPDFPYALGHKPLFYSNRFVTDIVIGLVFAIAVWLLPLDSHTSSNRWVQNFRIISDLSFPLYILHFPLLVLWRALFGYNVNDIGQLSFAIVAVTLISSLIGFLLEKQRGKWILLFKWIFTYIKPPATHPSQQVEPLVQLKK
ncbi:acyltransferase family protein [Hymenobacter aerilatus]|uniref:acyltransferase family protein n=1 Tax=Hymenobacter aerilatus TaxID=2932251 RepID=UPI0035C96B9E